MNNLKNLVRLYHSESLADQAIKEYNKGKPDEDKERFFLYDLISKRPADAVGLLNDAKKHAYILPCSKVDSFIGKPGEYFLNDETVLCNQQLNSTWEGVQITFLKFIVHADGKSFLNIGAQRPIPLCVFTTAKRLPMVPYSLEDMGLPADFSL